MEFEPVALGRHRRRVDPLAIGMVVVAIALAAAVLKPWDLANPRERSTVTDAEQTAGTDASGMPRQSEPAVSASPDPPMRIATPPLTWADIATVGESHDAWGVRAFAPASTGTSTATRSPFVARWSPVISIGRSGPRAIVQPRDRSIVALGLTFPNGRAPLDVRIWRRSAAGVLYWLDARPIGREPAQGGLVFAPPTTDPGSPGWGPGEYRVDALTADGTIERFELDIPDRYEQVRPSSIDPPEATELVSASQVDPTSLPVGAFATIDRAGYPLDSVGGPALDEAGAWLDTEPGSGRIPADRVAVAYLPRATGLGVRLPDGSVVRAASIERLTPNLLRNPPTPVGGGIIDRRDTDPWVVFAARHGEAWAPGIYRMSVTWQGPDGIQEAAWHVELRPGPYTGPPKLLALTRAWARHAGGSGLVVGRAEPLEGGPRSSAIRLLQTADRGAFRGQDGSATTCGGTIVGGTPEAFGLAYPADEPLTVTRVRLDGPEPPAWQSPTLLASDVVPGLSLIAPTDGASFRPGVYRIGLEGAAGSRTLTLCVGGASAVGG